MWTRDEIHTKLKTLDEERDRLLMSANLALGRIEGMTLVWREYLATLDSEVKPAPTSES